MNRTASVMCAAGLAGLVSLPSFAEPGDPSLRYQIDVEAFVPPVQTRQDLPHYSAGLRRAGIDGQVVLTGKVDADGQLNDLTTQNGHPMLARAAKRAVERWEFQPAQSEGRAIAVNIKVKVNFVLHDDRSGVDQPVSPSSRTTVSFSRPQDPVGS